MFPLRLPDVSIGKVLINIKGTWIHFWRDSSNIFHMSIYSMSISSRNGLLYLTFPCPPSTFDVYQRVAVEMLLLLLTKEVKKSTGFGCVHLLLTWYQWLTFYRVTLSVHQTLLYFVVRRGAGTVSNERSSCLQLWCKKNVRKNINLMKFYRQFKIKILDILQLF